MEFMPFTRYELGQQDFARGELRGFGGDGIWGERVLGWDAAYDESLEKAAGGLRRIHAGRYESENGQWSIVENKNNRWLLLCGIASDPRAQTEIDIFPTFTGAMAALRKEAEAK